MDMISSMKKVWLFSVSGTAYLAKVTHICHQSHSFPFPERFSERF
jgi:hypothetical protein